MASFKIYTQYDVITDIQSQLRIIEEKIGDDPEPTPNYNNLSSYTGPTNSDNKITGQELIRGNGKD